MTKEKNSRQNSVHIVGYLKENLLEQVINSQGVKVIRGSLIIATDDINSHKVQFYIPETNRGGEVSGAYESVSKLLPENTISVASYLKNTPSANFSTAANASTKVWAMARFDEYVTRKGERESSFVSLKGFTAGIKVLEDGVFNPHAEFTCDTYIESLEKEVVKNEETGRVLLGGILINYDGVAQKIDFVAPKEDRIADYILANYHVGDTVTIKGDIINASYREAVDDNKNSDFFGRSGDKVYITRFTRERKILGGSKQPLSSSDAGYISKEVAAQGLASREIKISNTGSRGSFNRTTVESPVTSVEELDF